MLTSQVFTSPVAPATLLVAMDITWDIGDVIRKLRKRARMNQTTLAAKVGVNKATIVRAEASDAKVSRQTYLKIAHVLKTDIATLESEAARLQSEQQDDPIQDTSVPPPRTTETVIAGTASKRAASVLKRDGPRLADSPADFSESHDGQTDSVPEAPRPVDREVRRAAQQIQSIAKAVERTGAVVKPIRAPRSARQHAAAARAPAAGGRARHRKHGR
jgi:transcriptional regulator with XRE-family HTH domain